MNYMCTNYSQVLQLVGYSLLFFRILLPTILIVWELKHLKDNIQRDTKEQLSKSIYRLIRTIVLGILIYFLPLIILNYISLVTDFQYMSDVDGSGVKDTHVCKSCLISPYGKLCRKKVYCAKINNENLEICYDENF